MNVAVSPQNLNDLERRFRQDGAIYIKDAFSEKDMNIITEAYEYRMAHLTRAPIDFKGGGGSSTDTNMTDVTNPETWSSHQFQRLFWETPIADLALACCGGKNLWLYYEQVFFKEGESRRTPWHQDASYLPVEGENLIRL